MSTNDIKKALEDSGLRFSASQDEEETGIIFCPIHCLIPCAYGCWNGNCAQQLCASGCLNIQCQLICAAGCAIHRETGVPAE